MALLQGVDIEGEVGLEIGPLDKPLVARTNGRAIYYADYAPREELAGRSAGNAFVVPDNIVSVDFLVRPPLPRDLGMRFDYIVASHVGEHVPDFLGWLETLFGWLRPRGRVILALPDKRYCFDYLRPVSSVGELLEAYHLKRTAPAFATVYDAFEQAVEFDTARGWREEPYRGPLDRKFSRAVALQLATEALRGEYVDCHNWVFTYSSFMQAIADVNELGIVKIDVLRDAAPVADSNEFHVVLAPS